MHHPSFRRGAVAMLCALALNCAVRAQNQTVNGNLTVTGTIGSAGAIDSDSNTFSFGTQGASFGGALLYQDANADTFTFSANRSPASWRWLHLSNVTAMRLDADHQLILYQSNGTTAGVTLTPASNQLSLGTATLTANGTALTAGGAFTAAGAFTASAGITNTNGSFTGPSSLSLTAGGSNQNITLTPSGVGRVVISNGTDSGLLFAGSSGGLNAFHVGSATNVPLAFFSNSSGPRMVVGTSGNVGIGTNSPFAKLAIEQSGGEQVVARYNSSNARAGLYTGGISGATFLGSNLTHASGNVFNYDRTGLMWHVGNPAGQSFFGIGVASGTAGNSAGTDGNDNMRFVIGASGNVGIGTTSPGELLTVGSTTASPNIQLGRWAFLGQESSHLTTVIGGNVKVSGNTSVVADTTVDGYRAIRMKYDEGITLHAYQGSVTAGSTVGAERMRITPSGNVGIGTTNPTAKLQVGDYTRFKAGDWSPPLTPGSTSAGERIVFYEGPVWKTAIGMDGQNGIWFQVHTPSGQVAYQWFTGGASAAPTEKMRLMENGNVGIGTTTPSHKLAVKGTIRANEVIVDTGWADYVFEESYRLAPLSEVEAHIQANKHLPGIPSAAEVAEHGVSMGDMQAKLLSKVEELTLHLIAQEKFMNSQQGEIAALRRRIAELETNSVR
jgi:hypothetical protein